MCNIYYRCHVLAVLQVSCIACVQVSCVACVTGVMHCLCYRCHVLPVLQVSCVGCITGVVCCRCHVGHGMGQRSLSLEGWWSGDTARAVAFPQPPTPPPATNKPAAFWLTPTFFSQPMNTGWWVWPVDTTSLWRGLRRGGYSHGAVATTECWGMAPTMMLPLRDFCRPCRTRTSQKPQQDIPILLLWPQTEGFTLAVKAKMELWDWVKEASRTLPSQSWWLSRRRSKCSKSVAALGSTMVTRWPWPTRAESFPGEMATRASWVWATRTAVTPPPPFPPPTSTWNVSLLSVLGGFTARLPLQREVSLPGGVVVMVGWDTLRVKVTGICSVVTCPRRWRDSKQNQNVHWWAVLTTILLQSLSEDVPQMIVLSLRRQRETQSSLLGALFVSASASIVFKVPPKTSAVWLLWQITNQCNGLSFYFLFVVVWVVFWKGYHHGMFIQITCILPLQYTVTHWFILVCITLFLIGLSCSTA